MSLILKRNPEQVRQLRYCLPTFPLARSGGGPVTMFAKWTLPRIFLRFPRIAEGRAGARGGPAYRRAAIGWAGAVGECWIMPAA
jgi:hypothetical protein